MCDVVTICHVKNPQEHSPVPQQLYEEGKKDNSFCKDLICMYKNGESASHCNCISVILFIKQCAENIGVFGPLLLY